MSPERQRFDPPEPPRELTRARSVSDSGSSQTQQDARGRVSRGTIAVLSVATLVVAVLVTALVLSWGVTTQPAAGERAPQPGASSPGEDQIFDVPTSTANTLDVQPGDTVPISVDAKFEHGFTLVPPSAGDWATIDLKNRPDQFTARNADMSIEVWQTSVYDSGQSDESLTIAQLNRIGDECHDHTADVTGPDSYELKGKDGTRLELLVAKTAQCESGELWLLERIMPKTGVRVHIVLYSGHGIEQSPELLKKLDEVSFTSP